MFERFTERGRCCIYFARQSAAGYGSPTIETEHFILAILHEDPNLIGRFLPSKTTKEIRVGMEKRLVKTEASTSIDIPLSLYCKRILAYGAEEAERLGHRHIDVDHLFIGVVREEDGTAGQILRSAGLNVVDMRQRMHLNDAATE